MNGNLLGSDPISNAAVLSRGFAATPTDMTMQMHMGMVMYAPTKRLTFMAMVPFVVKTMNHVDGGGARFTERTRGLGDVEVRGLYSLYARKNLKHRLLLNAGLGLPSGSIDGSMAGMRLEYPMQLGSGTVSLLPGITYLGQINPWGWGAELLPTLRLGRNSNGYRLGNRYDPSIWVARELRRWLAVSARAKGEWWQNIRGADPVLDPLDEPTKDPKLQGGQRLDMVFGTTFQPTAASLKGQQFSVQTDLPVIQSLDGPQLKRRWVARVAWQLDF